ncbi:MAG: hypothetical protein OXG05_15220 [Gammaproteobacteria bacterium]|nr:hypothetical protein [Gammaproteobacteria bacterium]
MKLIRNRSRTYWRLVGCATLCLLIGTSSSAREANDQRHMEEIVVKGERIVIDTRIAFERLTDSNAKGARLYKHRKYKEALPYLLHGAQVGFKMSQARLGTIYLYGLGGVERNVEKGIGWLGVASEPRTSPEIRNMWRKVDAQIPTNYRAHASSLVDKYREMYGVNATGTTCEMVPNTKSFVSRLECSLSDELFRFASAEEKLSIACFTELLPSACPIQGYGLDEYVDLEIYEPM